MKSKNTICLWFEKDAEAAANFYATTFPDSKAIAVHRAPGDFPNGKAGDLLTVESGAKSSLNPSSSTYGIPLP